MTTTGHPISLRHADRRVGVRDGRGRHERHAGGGQQRAGGVIAGARDRRGGGRDGRHAGRRGLGRADEPRQGGDGALDGALDRDAGGAQRADARRVGVHRVHDERAARRAHGVAERLGPETSARLIASPYSL